MKSILIAGLIILSGALSAQELPPKLAEKAKKNAELEIKNLPPKGWKVNGMNQSFEEMITAAWQKRFAMVNEKTPYYIAGYGNGSGSTIEIATQKAIDQAKQQLPGLVVLYFSTWNSVSDLSDADKEKVDKAISKAGDAIISTLSGIEQDPDVNMYREKRGYSVTVRYFWDQMAIRETTRELIIKELKETTDWSRDKMIKILTYEQ